MPETEDGGDVGKIKPDERLMLDSGNANPPLSVRMQIETDLTKDEKSELGTSRQAALLEARQADVTLLLGGTIGKNLSYYAVDVAARSATGGVEQMWIGVNNLVGPGIANVRYGLIPNSDFDARPGHRHDLGAGLSHSGVINSTAGSTSTFSDINVDAVGLQVFGRPGFGPITYMANADTHDRAFTNSINFGLLIRGDMGPFSASYHYEGNNARKNTWDGKDISRTSHLISARAIIPNFEASIAYGIYNQTDKSGAQDVKDDTNAFVLEAIYFAEMFDVQAQYGIRDTKRDPKVSLTNGNTDDANDQSQFLIKVDFKPTDNSKIFLKFVSNSLKTENLKNNDAFTDDFTSIGVDWAF
jgi:hypothetical protein